MWSPPSPPMNDPASSPAMSEWRELYRRTREQVGDPVARWLCEEASGADQESGGFDGVLGERASPRLIAHLDDMVARHLAGEPLAYVLGHWSFRRLDLAVDRRVLIPRPETEVVAGVALELARDAAAPADRRRSRNGFGGDRAGPRRRTAARRRHRVVDRCQRRRDRRRPRQPRRPRSTRPQRAHRHGVVVRRLAARDAARPRRRPTRRMSLTTRPTSNRPSGSGSHRSPCSPGRTGSTPIRAIVAGAPGWIRSGGWLVLEIGADQGPAVAHLLAGPPGTEAVGIRPDLTGRDRVAVARLP